MLLTSIHFGDIEITELLIFMDEKFGDEQRNLYLLSDATSTRAVDCVRLLLDMIVTKPGPAIISPENPAQEAAEILSLYAEHNAKTVTMLFLNHPLFKDKF